MIVKGTNIGTSDGRGGKENISGAKVDPRYVYYRLYTKEGPLESQNAIYSNDRFISRTLSKSVTPPHNAASLKRHLCWIEGFQASKDTSLYLSLSETTSVEDSTRIPLRAKDPGLGSSELEPIAVVIDVSAAEKRSAAASTADSGELPQLKDEERYVYYRVYNENGDIASKTSFDEMDVSLGRINIFSVPPPHMVASLKARLVKVEAVVDRDVQLFEDDEGDTAIKDSDFLALFSDSCPGINEDAPLALVHGPQNKISDSQPQDLVSGFTKKLKATGTYDWGKYDSAWHSVTAGEIFKTNGVSKNEVLKSNGSKYLCYEAINLSGKRAFVLSCHSRLC